VREAGADPASDNGRLWVELFTRIAADAEYREKFSKFSQSRGMFGGQFSSDEKERIRHREWRVDKTLAQHHRRA